MDYRIYDLKTAFKTKHQLNNSKIRHQLTKTKQEAASILRFKTLF